MSSRATLEFLAGSLVDHPDEVRVEQEDSGSTIFYDLYVHSDDVGKVIGRNGRIARAIRTVVKAAAAAEDKKAVVAIVD